MIKPLQSITLKNDNGEDTTYVVASAPAIVETTEPADVASFSDGAEGIPVSSLIADINPVQAGSGDPSPSNVRPITGWTGTNVVRTGKNLFDISTSTTKSFIDTNGTASTSDNWSASDYISVKAGQTYTLSGVTNTGWAATHSFYDENKQFISYVYAINGNTFTAPDGAYYVRLSLRSETPTAAQLEIGSTATAFEPYNGTTYPISWADEAGTVYGGTLDVTTGLLTVTQEILTINDVSWNYYTPSSGNSYFYHTEPTKAPVPVGSSENPLICSILPYGGSNYANQFTDGKIWQAANTNIYIVDTSVTTVSAMKTKYGTGTVVFPLATPQTYQLTPQAVLTILGTNNIWADTGDVEVAYCADTKMYIDKVIAAL